MEIQHLINIIIAAIASTGFWSFVNTAWTSKHRKKSAESTAMLALLHDKLYFLTQKYIERGSITADEYENICYLYEPYIKLGGNGTCKRLMEEVRKLKIQGGKSE